MRVPNISTYVNATYRLGNLTSDLENSNEIVNTQKQINEISDDPLGLSQVLSLRSSLGNLEQIEQNVNTGRSWIQSVENTLDGVNDLILKIKADVARLASDSITGDERKSAIEIIENGIEQITTFGNTQINGSYIFGGTDTDKIPLEYDKDLGKVFYKGDEAFFGIRTGKELGIEVGKDGQEAFWDQEIHINSTNNTIVFTEDNGHGSASKKVLHAVIDDGLYKKQDLVTIVRNSLNDVSASQGYGVVYDVEYNEEEQKYYIQEDGSFAGHIKTEFLWESGGEAFINNVEASSSIGLDNINIIVNNSSALIVDTPLPHGTEPFRLTWQGDGTWSIDNNPGYVILPFDIPGTKNYIGIDFNESGTADLTIELDKPVTTKGQFIEFEIVSEKGDHSIGHEIGFDWENLILAPPVSDEQAKYVTELTIRDGVNDQIVFEEVNSAGVATTLTVDLTGVDIEFTDMDTLSQAIETAMEASSVNGINYAVSYDQVESRFIIREDGSSLNELNLLWSTNAVSSATASTLGYYPLDDSITYPESNFIAQSYITIDDTNNRLAFEETTGGGSSGILWATIAQGIYKDMSELETAVETAMNSASVISGNSTTYTASYSDATNQFSIYRSGGGALTGLDLLWSTAQSLEHSIGDTLGFDFTDDIGGGLTAGTAYASDSDMVLMTFDTTNNAIDFEEVSIDGIYSDEINVRIPEGDYTELSDVAAEIQIALRDASPHGVDYIVDYDYASGQFRIKGSDSQIKSFTLFWQTGINQEQSADEMLGFYGDDIVSFSESDEAVVNITIDATNNKIDFREFLQDDIGKTVGNLTASIRQKIYTSHFELASEVETALEAESRLNGNIINYSVTWDDYTKKFTIKESGTELEQLELMWQTGDNAPASAGGTDQSIGNILGFDPEDDVHTPLSSAKEVEWGIFDTLIDLKIYLSNNDRDGIERSLGRLEQNFDLMTARIVDAGMKFNQLEIRQAITSQVGLNLTERKSMIEDADIIESIMNLKNMEIAYQAALNSTSKILNLSLLDYL